MNKKIVISTFTLYTLFIIYNTLIPFKMEYSWQQVDLILQNMKWEAYVDDRGFVSITDIVGNVLLFIPFGFLLYMLLKDIGVYKIFFLVFFLSLFLSSFIEFFQLFIKSRNTAVHDLINNTIGGLVGAFAAAVYSGKLSRVSRKIFYNLLAKEPFLLLLSTVGFIQLVAAVAPFTVSITISYFKKSIKTMNLIPFDYQSFGKLYFNSPNKNDLLPFDWYSFVEDTLFWIVIGYLLFLCYRMYWRHRSHGRVLLISIPLIYFPLREFLQIFIISRFTDINDIISGYLGVFIGFVLYYLFQSVRRKMYTRQMDLMKIPLVLYSIFIIYAGLQPFDWNFNLKDLSSKLDTNALVPFYAYFRDTSLWNIYDLVNSLTYFLPISLFCSIQLWERKKPWFLIYILMGVSGLLLGLMIEVSQIFSTVRVAEITDVLAYSLGGIIGTFLLYYYQRQIQPNLELFQNGVLEFA